MKLQAYLDSVPMKPAEFAKSIRVKRQTVERYCAGERIPIPSVMSRIVTASGGRVRPEDFYDIGTTAN